MSYRFHGHAIVDPSDPRATARCDRCGGWFNLRDLRYQFAWQGTQIINTGFLVCPDRCLDDLQPQLKAVIIPPDPPPVRNARPEQFDYAEVDWLVTQDGNPIVTQSGDNLITQVPNPANAAAQANITATFSVPSATSLASVYVDLFIGPPSGGNSILAAVTGSSGRLSIASALWTGSAVIQNSTPLVFTTNALAQSNVTSAGLYDASSGGNLLASANVGVTEPMIVSTATVQFTQGDLTINLI